jgi:hypothetical protein
MELEITRRTRILGVWQDAGRMKTTSVEAALEPLGALPGDVVVLEAPDTTDRRFFFEVVCANTGRCMAQASLNPARRP